MPINNIINYEQIYKAVWFESKNSPFLAGTNYFTYNVVNNELYKMGGLTTIATLCVQKYNPATRAWTTKATFPGSVTRWGHSAVAVGSKIYVFGGATGTIAASTPQSNTWEYDTVNDSWAVKTAMPGVNSHMQATVLGTNIYIVGGTTTTGIYAGGTLAVHWKYDTLNDTWDSTNLEPLPQYYERCDGTYTTVGDNLYLIGGWRGTRSAKGFENTVRKYSTTSNTWTNLGTTPAQMIGHTTVKLSDNLLFVVGSVTNTGYMCYWHFLYDVGTDDWSIQNANPNPGTWGNQEGGRAFVLDDEIWYSAYVHLYDLPSSIDRAFSMMMKL